MTLDLHRAVPELLRTAECEWLEYKRNNADPEEIGSYISALSNGAAHADRPRGYLLWGIEDGTRAVIGTTFTPDNLKIQGQELRSWLTERLSPSPDFEFDEVEIDSKRVVVLTVPAAMSSPVQFKHEAFVRIGSYKKLLRAYPEMERALWRKFDVGGLEESIVAEGLSTAEVLELLEVDSYFTLLDQPRPGSDLEALGTLERDRLLVASLSGGWDVTGLGALVLASQLEEFPTVRRKAVRLVHYEDIVRGAAVDAATGRYGYAVGFKPLVKRVQRQLPRREVKDPQSRMVEAYPPLAVRELIANALIHQDFHVSGAGPLIELFPDRMEISNPGVPLMAVDRILDAPPHSRNEALASFMRRVGLCEERGSGVDQAILQAEISQLPTPDFRTSGSSTIAVLFGPRSLDDMSREERVRAIYWHACLKFVSNTAVTNTTIRERFGLTDSSRASRMLSDAVDAEMIAIKDPKASKRYIQYVPYWAV
jgi:ATP-dependent DNA helicase RecG